MLIYRNIMEPISLIKILKAFPYRVAGCATTTSRIVCRGLEGGTRFELNGVLYCMAYLALTSPAPLPIGTVSEASEIKARLRF